ncbi:MAG: phosphoribosylanthranilate isomerase [Akkermansiaceae bacterium]
MKSKLKICGVTTTEDAHNLVDIGVHALGVNFWNKSKRYINPQKARPFLDSVQGKIQRIGVFVDEDISTVKQIMQDGLIDAAQLHGNENIAYCEELINSNLNFIKVIRVQPEDNTIHTPESAGNQILLDTYVSGYGGAGKRFDWNLASNYIKHHPDFKVIIAGGITTQNIAEAASINPYMIDVASGAEISPGIKNMDKVKTMLNLLG